MGSMGLCESGVLVLALRSTVALFDAAKDTLDVIASVVHAKPNMRFNDGKVGPDGAFWVGSMDGSGDADPGGALYRIAPDGNTSFIASRLRASNGLAWDATGTRMYHSDSQGPWIDVLDFDPRTGAAVNRRRWINLDEAKGRPDGGACDSKGDYWSAGISASRINRFSAGGELLDWVEVPNLMPTMPCFGGVDFRTVFVTSLSGAADVQTLTDFPHCGKIVSFLSDVPGLPGWRFRR